MGRGVLQIGLISDTHGLLRPEAVVALRGADLILHAGDIGKQSVLDALAEIASVEAIAGNVDRAWCTLPEQRSLLVGDTPVVLVHDSKTLDPTRLGDVVVCGHSHRPGIEAHDGRLWVNPGSAGPRRFSLPVCVGWLVLGDGPPRARLIPLEVAPPRSRARSVRPR